MFTDVHKCTTSKKEKQVRPKLKNPRMSTVGVRLHAHLKDAVQEIADATDRSMSWHIERALTEYVERWRETSPSTAHTPALQSQQT